MKPGLQDLAAKGEPSLAWASANATVNGALLPTDVKDIVGNAGEIMAATKIQLAEKGEIVLQFPNGFRPAGIWIDGKQATDGTATLEAGIHKIVIRAVLNDRPIRMTCATGTFIPEWP